MADTQLNGLRVAFVVTDGFEQVELTEPRKALDAAGAETEIVSPKEGQVRAWKFTDWGDSLPVDRPLSQTRPEDYDALVLPGGVINPDKLRLDADALVFIQSFFDDGKPVAAICHGPWTIIETGKAKGRRMTSWPSLETDLLNAGAEWVDQSVVVDGNLVTSRKPDDLPDFNREMIKLFGAARRGNGARRGAGMGGGEART
jgi:protease I